MLLLSFSLAGLCTYPTVSQQTVLLSFSKNEHIYVSKVGTFPEKKSLFN